LIAAVPQTFAKLRITNPLRSICPALWSEPLPTTTAERIVNAGVRPGASLADVALYRGELTGLAEAVAAVSGGTARVTRHGLCLMTPPMLDTAALGSKANDYDNWAIW
jgi:hypothetical protein